MSSRQLLAVAEATVMQQSGIKEVIDEAANESSTCTTDTEGEQDGLVRVNCIGNCPVQPADQRKKKERGAMADQHDKHSGSIVNRWNGRIVLKVMSN